ncbi:MAG: hypothetical protein QXD19_00220 [Candidatus Bathyarchaeia archaeon]
MKDYSQYGFREHGVMLYLDKTLYKAFIKLQADKELGRSYAGLLPFVEGLFHLGYLSKEDYEKYVQKYTQGLKEEPKPLTLEQLKEKQLLEHKERYFQGVLEQWDLHPDSEWRAKKLAEAKQWKDRVESARRLLAVFSEG